MYGLSGRTLRERIERRLHQVGLWERRNQIARQLSGGMRRRLEIARGVLHAPRVLFLDEPTTGLDPQSRRAIWDMFGELRVARSGARDHPDDARDGGGGLPLRRASRSWTAGRILCEDSPEALEARPRDGRARGARDRPRHHGRGPAGDRGRTGAAQPAFRVADARRSSTRSPARPRAAGSRACSRPGVPHRAPLDRARDARGRVLLLHRPRAARSAPAP